MVSYYLERSLRTLEKAIEDRAQAPGARSARSADPAVGAPVGPNVTGLGSVELLVRVLTENTNQDGAIEAPAPTLARAAAGQRSPLDRNRAA